MRGELMSRRGDGIQVAAKNGRILIKRLRVAGGQKIAAPEYAVSAGLKVGDKFDAPAPKPADGKSSGGKSVAVKSDIEIAREAKMKPIDEVAKKLGIPADALIQYGPSKAKVSFDFIDAQKSRPDGKLILVTAINPTPAGEGKTNITVASEVMAILCLALDLKDLERRLGNVVAGYTRDKKPVRARDLKADGAMTVLLKDALMPNLVQTLENNPVFIHGGPFANIAHGCNSVLATRTALKLADYVVTEAGFGADLGAEKFFDIKCRKAGLNPSAAVIVDTVRA